MTGEFVRHASSEDGFMFGMVKNVKPNHAGVQIAVVAIVLHYRISVSTYDSTPDIKPALSPDANCFRARVV
jgi:hypothetical protein